MRYRGFKSNHLKPLIFDKNTEIILKKCPQKNEKNRTFSSSFLSHESSHDLSALSGDPLKGPDPLVGNHWTELAQIRYSKSGLGTFRGP